MKNKIGIGIAILILGVGIWYFTQKPKPTIKDRAYWIKNIVEYTNKKLGTGKGASVAELSDTKVFDDAYLQAWSEAIDFGSDFFIYKNVSCLTIDGSTEIQK